MMVLCILLAMLSLFLSLKLIYQRKLVQKVKKQIDFLIDRDTQTEIMVEKTDGTIQDLAASINHLLKKYRSMGQEIERSDTLFRDTITSLSHDLRTPLATANGYIQLLQEQDLTGEQKEYVTIAGERISAVKLLLDQLFEFARIEADELKLNCRNTDIHSVLRDVVASYYGDFEQKKCVPYIVIPNPPAIIWGDPNALTRIFSNVVYNALVHGEGNYQITAAIEEAQTVITIKNASSSIQQEDMGYLDSRSMYDVQINSRYNDVYEKNDLPTGNYEVVTDFLTEEGIAVSADCAFSLYLPNCEDFHDRVKHEFPVVAISLSDYNAIREMLGYEAITLEENEFTTQWHTTATTDEQEEFIRSHAVVATDVGRLTLSEQASYQEAMGETLYNSYTRVVYVFPDSVCQNLLSVNRNRYIQTSKELSYSDAAALENRFIKVYPELSENGVGYSIRLSTLQINEAKGMNFILKTAMIYGAVVLMVICLTILSLQQLLDAGQYRYRFAVLRKLGVEEQDIKGLVMKQLGVWFGLPVVVSIIVSAIVVAYFLQSVSVEISAYIGIGALITQLSITISILILLLVCYFLSTWILFRRSITE